MSSERLAELVERAADGDVSATEDHELALLLADPTQLQNAVAQWRMAMQVRAHGGCDGATVAALAVATVAGGASGRRRGVWREIDRRQTWRRWEFGAVAALVLFSLGGWWTWSSRSAVRDASGAILAPGVVAGTVQYPDGSRIVLNDGTAAVLEPNSRLRLEHGRLQADIAHQESETPFQIAAPHGAITVVGTSFSAMATPQYTLVRVIEGRVRLTGTAAVPTVDLPTGTVGVIDAEGPLLLPGAGLSEQDRRPLLGVSLCNGSFPGNPRGWLQDREFISADTVEFRSRMLNHATALNQAARNCGARGIVVWGLEGWHRSDFYYAGDPRSLSALAPEMDAIADEFFARLRLGGISTGVVVKPGRVVRQSARWEWQLQGLDVRAELMEKVTYARQRWGCSLFFYGFNLTQRGQVEALAGRQVDDADILPWRDLLAVRQAYPDSMIIAEYQAVPGWGVAPGWRDASAPTVSSQVRAEWPRPPLVIAINTGQSPQPALREALLQGAIPLFMIAPENDPHATLEDLRSALK